MTPVPLGGALILAAYLSTAAAGEHLRLGDDKGKPLLTTVRVCFQAALTQDCRAVPPGERIEPPPDFVSLQAEGEDYGPVVASRAAIADLVAHGEPLRIPRKATVKVVGELPQALSVYRIADAEAGRPALRADSALAQGVKLPAGELIGSLWKAGNAPDLQRLDLEPGSVHSLRFHQYRGWSLVLRVEDPKSGQPVPSAVVELRPMAGYSPSSKTFREIRTDSLGLVLLSGLTDPLLEATIRHPKYLATRVPAILASPGTFAFRRVRLDSGFVARAQVIFLGRERPGATCEVVMYVQGPTGKAQTPQLLFSGITDREGVCQTDPLPAGTYVLRVAVAGSPAHAEVGFDHAIDQETRLTVELLPSKLSGSVTLGKEPAVGYQVELHSNSAAIPARTEKEATATAVSGDEGQYEATVWLPGAYFALATTPAGTPAAGKQIQLEPGENALDFELDGAGISGLAVDESGKPVEGAGIVVRWRGESGRGSRVGRSGADGTFHFPMLDSGHVVVEGNAKGYKSPPAEEMEFVAGIQPPAVRLVFAKEPVLRGELRTAAGQPVANGWVALFASFPEARSGPSALTRTDASGRFEIASPGERSSRGFASGPGCPLVSFALAANDEEMVVNCPGQPAALSIVIRDENNEAVANARVILLRDGAVIPWHALATHLGTLGLPAASDAYGRLTLAALAPGEYRAYLLDATSEELIRSGSDQGFLGSFRIGGLELTEVEVEIDRGRLPRISGE